MASRSNVPATSTNRAREFDEVLSSGARTDSYLKVAKFLGDVEAHLRKEDKNRVFKNLDMMGKARDSEEFAALKESTKVMLSGEPSLLARFDDFMSHALAISGRKSDDKVYGQQSSSDSSPAAGSSSTSDDYARSGSGSD